jgi:hypothetical protein
MIKKILVVIAVLVAAILIYAAFQPDTFRVERSLSINAQPGEIFPLVNDLHNHGLWSPWEKKDPAMKRTHSGAPSGKGAIYEWDGNHEIGQGRMEITESVPDSRVVFAMRFIKPFEAHNVAEIMLEPQGDSTTVTWAIGGPMPYFSKLFGLFCNMDQMIGKEFETGLANLKSLTEK